MSRPAFSKVRRGQQLIDHSLSGRLGRITCELARLLQRRRQTRQGEMHTPQPIGCLSITRWPQPSLFQRGQDEDTCVIARPCRVARFRAQLALGQLPQPRLPSLAFRQVNGPPAGGCPRNRFVRPSSAPPAAFARSAMASPGQRNRKIILHPFSRTLSLPYVRVPCTNG